MTNRGRNPVSFATIQDTRASCTAALNKAFDNLKAIPTSTAEAVSHLNTEDVEEILNSTQLAESTFLQAMENAQLFIPEEDEDNFHLREAIIEESFDETMFQIMDLGEQLLLMKTISNGLSKFYSDLQTIQATFYLSSRDKQVSDIRQLTILFSSLREKWQPAKNPSSHPLQLEFDVCTRSLAMLRRMLSHNIHRQGTQSLKSTNICTVPASRTLTSDTAGCHQEVVAVTDTEQSSCQPKSHDSTAVPLQPKLGPSQRSPSSNSSYKWDCLLCHKEKHPLHICPKWATLIIPQRLDLITQKKLCSNCLAGGHSLSACRSKYDCKICHQAHHTTIHQGIRAVSDYNSSQLPQSQQSLEALITTPLEQQLKARAYIHPDANPSILSNKTAQALKLPLQTDPTQSHNFQCSSAAMQSVTENISCQQLAPVEELPLPLSLQLADHLSKTAERVDILLGAEFQPQLQEATLPNITLAPESGAQGPLQQKILAHHSTLSLPADTHHSLEPDSSPSCQAEESDLPLHPAKVQNNYYCSNPISLSISNCRPQITLSEKSDGQPLGNGNRQAVIPKMALSQQPWEKGQKKPPIWRNGPASPTPSQLHESHTHPDSVIPELLGFSNSREHSTSTSLAIDQNAVEHSTSCVNTTVLSQELQPLLLLSEIPGPTSQQPPQKELLDFSHSNISTSPTLLNNKQLPQQELLPLHHPVVHPRTTLKEHPSSTSSVSSITYPAKHPPICVDPDLLPRQPLPLSPWKEEPPLLHEDLGLIPKQQLPEKELLALYHPVDSSTTLSTRTSNLGKLTSICNHVLSNVDWCWKCCSTYKGAPSLTATNCVPLVISTHQTPAISSLHNLSSAEKETAGMWLMKQAKLHLPTFNPSSIFKNRFRSKTSRLMPWHTILNDYDRLASSYFCHPLQHQPTTGATTYWTYDWSRHPGLTLCLHGFLYCHLANANLLLLSARRLSRFIYSMPYWRNKQHLSPQLKGEPSAVTNDCTTLVLHRRMDNIFYQNIAASGEPFLRCSPWNNPRQFCDLLTVLNSQYLLHLYLLKLLIRWLHIPAGSPYFKTLWPLFIISMMQPLLRIMDTTISPFGNHIKPPLHRLPPGVCSDTNPHLNMQQQHQQQPCPSHLSWSHLHSIEPIKLDSCDFTPSPIPLEHYITSLNSSIYGHFSVPVCMTLSNQITPFCSPLHAHPAYIYSAHSSFL